MFSNWKCWFCHSWRRLVFWNEDNHTCVHLVGVFECIRCGTKQTRYVTLR